MPRHRVLDHGPPWDAAVRNRPATPVLSAPLSTVRGPGLASVVALHSERRSTMSKKPGFHHARRQAIWVTVPHATDIQTLEQLRPLLVHAWAHAT